jgi:T5SS/PEP-CTERM-associated repeat protein
MKNKSVAPSLLTGLLVALTFAASSSPARADTTWAAALGGDWLTSMNWSNGVPGTSTDASINNGTTAVVDKQWAVARKLTLGAATGDSGPLLVDGTGAFDGVLTVGPCSICDGTVVEGSFYVGREGEGSVSIVNGGVVYSKGYAYIAPEVGASGTVTVDGADSTWQVGSTDNQAYYGKLLVGADQGSPDGGTAILSVTNGGSVIVTNGFASSTGVTVGSSGTLTGNGSLTVSAGSFVSRLTNVFGTLAPSGGTLQLNGNLSLSSGALTLCTVTPSVVDRIDVLGTGTTGAVSLDGRLTVIVNGTLTPGPNCSLRITLLHADGGRGSTLFNSVSVVNTGSQKFNSQISYDANNVYLDLTFRNCQ